MIRTLIASVLLSTLSLAAIARPVVMAHRGASGYLPELTASRHPHPWDVARLYRAGLTVVQERSVGNGDNIHLNTRTNVAKLCP